MLHSATQQIILRNVVLLEYSLSKAIGICMWMWWPKNKLIKHSNIWKSSCHLREGNPAARTAVVITTVQSAQLKSDGYSLGNMECITKYSIDGNKTADFKFEGMVRRDSTLSSFTKQRDGLFGHIIYVCELPLKPKQQTCSMFSFYSNHITELVLLQHACMLSHYSLET